VRVKLASGPRSPLSVAIAMWIASGGLRGMKGMRVQVHHPRAPRPKKIDIIEFSEDPVVFATHALSPAKISRVSIVNGTKKHMEVIVDDTAALVSHRQERSKRPAGGEALGMERSISERRRKTAGSGIRHGGPGAHWRPVSILIDHGLADDIVEKLIEAGVGTVEKLGAMTPEDWKRFQVSTRTLSEKIWSRKFVLQSI